MAKKIVRGITDVKTINNQDFDTNNVNDLLSDGQYSYIHRKKGKSEEYHNLTDNIKTISSDNTDLLTVTNNNKTNNTATLHPKHDAQKEQVLESTRETISIHHGTNGTDEKTTVDTNPEKVLEHDNLLTDYGISKTKSGNTTKLGLEYTVVSEEFDLNNLTNGNIRCFRALNAPTNEYWYLVSAVTGSVGTIQEAVTVVNGEYRLYKRFKYEGSWGNWKQQATDKSVIDGLLAQKQNKLTGMGGISIIGDSITLNVKDGYSGDLNDLNDTCLAKPIDGTLNLPAGVSGNGILSVVRISDVISQKYHSLDNAIYTRLRKGFGDSPTWTPWVKVTTTALS